MTISSKEVLHVAHLARLRMDEKDVDTFSEQLAGILSYVEKLGELDTSSIPPTAHAVDMANAFREDSPAESLSTAEALANAPEVEDGEFIVSKIIE
jgi:aspartyl-tRNA(Asn)/glutamyl-tRNA(Gln) amidotransferase subunit C